MKKSSYIAVAIITIITASIFFIFFLGAFTGHARYATSPTGEWLIPLLLVCAIFFGIVGLLYLVIISTNPKETNKLYQEIIVKFHRYYSISLGAIFAIFLFAVMAKHIVAIKG
jgi:hypothetical protein